MRSNSEAVTGGVLKVKLQGQAAGCFWVWADKITFSLFGDAIRYMDKLDRTTFGKIEKTFWI